MKLRLEKWYLDFTSDTDVGFYYVMVITFGRIKIGFSGINHFGSSLSGQNFRFSRIWRCALHSLDLSKARFFSNINKADLSIDHGKIALKGSWNFRTQPLKRWRKPLYEDSNGWVDWKVWSPYADVKLEFRNGKEKVTLAGTGYIDFVRLTFPFWKVPIRTLFWGRMHSPCSWSVFLSLQTKQERIALYYDPQMIEQDVSVSLDRNPAGEARKMIWNIGFQDNQLTFDADITRLLESQEILCKGRLLKILPGPIRRFFSSSGRDEKYEMASRFCGQSYRGIMEEVKLHE